MSNDNERNGNEFGRGFTKGYNYGFWTGCIIATLGTIGVLYLIGIGIIPS